MYALRVQWRIHDFPDAKRQSQSQSKFINEWPGPTNACSRVRLGYHAVCQEVGIKNSSRVGACLLALAFGGHLFYDINTGSGGTAHSGSATENCMKSSSFS